MFFVLVWLSLNHQVIQHNKFLQLIVILQHLPLNVTSIRDTSTRTCLLIDH
nr:MAG TPA: hypothetical protein [Caudoviricetes sp.]